MAEPTDSRAEDTPDYEVPAARLREIEHWLDEGDIAHLEPVVDQLHEADVADLLEKTDPAHRLKLIELFADKLDAEVFSYLHSEVQRQVIESLPPLRVAAIVDELDSDDALALIEDLDPEFRDQVVGRLSVRMRSLVEQGLTFPEFSAGRLIQREVIAFPQFWTVGKTIDYLRATSADLPDPFYNLFVVDPMHRVSGVVALSRLLSSKRPVRLIDIADPDIDAIPATMDQEEVAFLFRQYGLVAAPVVDDGGRLLGVITIDDVVEVISQAAEEDILALGGVGEETDLYSPVLETTRSRFSWLALNLITAVVASIVIGLFEATLQQVVALAVLMPIVASMGGNAGTQTLTVAVRALATKQLSSANALRVIGKETLVGLLNGGLFAVLGGIVAWVWFGDPMLGLVIALAMLINLFAAGLFGAGIPLALARMKVDPALASSVFLTTVTDVVGFLAFLGLATIFLI